MHDRYSVSLLGHTEPPHAGYAIIDRVAVSYAEHLLVVALQAPHALQSETMQLTGGAQKRVSMLPNTRRLQYMAALAPGANAHGVNSIMSVGHAIPPHAMGVTMIRVAFRAPEHALLVALQEPDAVQLETAQSTTSAPTDGPSLTYHRGTTEPEAHLENGSTAGISRVAGSSHRKWR